MGGAVRQREHLFGLRWRQPVAGPVAMAFGAFHPPDSGGELGREDPVVGRLARELAKRAEPDIDGRGRKMPLFERGPVALDGGFIETGPAARGRPPVEVFEGGAVRPAGVGQVVEPQRFQAAPEIPGLGSEGEVGRKVSSVARDSL